jgi:hypothetical protein
LTNVEAASLEAFSYPLYDLGCAPRVKRDENERDNRNNVQGSASHILNEYGLADS